MFWGVSEQNWVKCVPSGIKNYKRTEKAFHDFNAGEYHYTWTQSSCGIFLIFTRQTFWHVLQRFCGNHSWNTTWHEVSDRRLYLLSTARRFSRCSVWNQLLAQRQWSRFPPAINISYDIRNLFQGNILTVKTWISWARTHQSGIIQAFAE